jgi:hypothetical protein
MHEARLRILYKLEKFPARRAPARAAIARGQALINLESAKLSLSIGEFNEARAPLIKANTFSRVPSYDSLFWGFDCHRADNA